MSKKLFTLFLLVLFAATLINAQEKTVLPDDSFIPTTTTVGKISPNMDMLTGEAIGVTTNYDYFSNSVVRDQIVWDAALGTPHLLNMIRPFDPAAPTSRRVVHSYKDAGTWINNDTRGAAAGWPHIDLGLTGDAAGLVAGVYHAGCNLFLWDGATGYPATVLGPNLDPSVQISGANIWLATSGDRTEFDFYKTEDFGTSFTKWAVMSDFSPTPIYWADNGGVEVGMSKSPNEQNLLYFGTNYNERMEIIGEDTVYISHVYEGVSPDSADNMWIILSSDAGANWTPSKIANDGVVDLVSGYHTPLYAPIFENFGQVDMAVANDGVVHAVANGYGPVFLDANADSVVANSFPVLYWNSTTDTWVSISDPAIDVIQEIRSYYPTNSIGQAYPSVSLSEDGQVIYVMWTGPQLDATGGLDTLEAGVGAKVYYWRDLYHAYSEDGGDTWTYGGVLAGETNLSEAFGHAAQHLEKVSETVYRAHIVYLADLNTGVSLFTNGGPATDNPVMYMTYDILVTSVDDIPMVRNFELAQNYPNPFNPSTVISYSLAERSNVTLKVYDVLGKEVANLVNNSQEAGTHQVTFDASNLATGLYIYTLNAGNFTSSKKMMLIK